MLAAAVILLVARLACTAAVGTTDSSLPPGSAAPVCPQGQVWSRPLSTCCRLCPPGTGATSTCVTDADDTTDDESSAVTVTVINNNDAEGAGGSCELCDDGVTFSATLSAHQACVPCSTCPKNARVVSTCNATQDTVCECETGLYLSTRTGRCELCDLCPVGWGASKACGGQGNTVCRKCQNGTFSDVLDAVEGCRPCGVCRDGERVLQACTSTQDTVCLSKYLKIPPPYPINGQSDNQDLASKEGYHINNADSDQPRGRPAHEDDDDIDVIPLYCAALGAVVVGLLAYVGFVHYRRMRDKRLSREPHEDVEYSKASGADSGVFVDPEHHQLKYHCVLTGSTRLRDLSNARKKELERVLVAGSRGPTDWKGLARELGYNSGKITSFESRRSTDPGAPYRHVMHDWARLEGATVTGFLRALRNTGRHDVVKYLQAECTEQLQPLTGTLPPHVV